MLTLYFSLCKNAVYKRVNQYKVLTWRNDVSFISLKKCESNFIFGVCFKPCRNMSFCNFILYSLVFANVKYSANVLGKC